MSYYCNDPRLVPNKRHSIVERDEAGNVIGTYTGFWNPDRRIVTLYPDYRHPALKGSVKLEKRRVYDGLVKCKRSDPSSTASGSNSPKGNAGAKSQTSGAMKDVIGQMKMKL